VTGVLVLFALEREAAPFRRLAGRGVTIRVSGVGRDRARAAAEVALRSTPVPRLVIAAGFCGALAPGLRVGDVVTSPRIVTVDHLVANPTEKRQLAERTGAYAVDMESAAVEQVCAARGVPFLAVRAVSDTADTALSPELVRLLSGGRVSPWRAAVALASKPSLLGEFRRLARDSKLAARNLAAALVEVIEKESPPVATGGLSLGM
jgi:adenosylhomocysteine nucleosidase